MHTDASQELLDRFESELGLPSSRGIVDKDAEARRRDEVVLPPLPYFCRSNVFAQHSDLSDFVACGNRSKRKKCLD